MRWSLDSDFIIRFVTPWPSRALEWIATWPWTFIHSTCQPGSQGGAGDLQPLPRADQPGDSGRNSHCGATGLAVSLQCWVKGLFAAAVALVTAVAQI